MKIVDILTNKFQTYLDLPEDKTEVLNYGLYVLCCTVMGYAVVLSISYLLNVFHIVLPMLLVHSLLRAFSGGAHGSKFTYCWSLSIIIFNSLSLLIDLSTRLFTWHTVHILIFDFIVFLVAFCIISTKAPVDVEEKPITSEKQRERLKQSSFAVLLIWYGIVLIMIKTTGDTFSVFLLASGVGVLWQVFTLTQFGVKFVSFYGKCLQTLGI